jgi:HpiC1 cyclase
VPRRGPVPAPWWSLAAAGLLLLSHAVPVEAAATIEIVDLDGAGEGLNDSTVVTPQGGNAAATLGAARLQAVEFAASVWAESLDSPVPIRVGVQFDPLGGSAGSAVLGLTGPAEVFRDFLGAPRPGTWYPSALADKLAGLDLGGPGSLDVLATFNSDVDGATVLGSSRFYYGFDDHPAAADVDFLQAAVHELAHGLGFMALFDLSTGAKLLGYDDAFLLDLERHGASPPDLPSMSDAQRLAALTAGPDLHWVGPRAMAAAAGHSGGLGAGGHLEMYAPDPLSPSSINHLSTDFTPDEVMEPSYVGPIELDQGLDVTLALLEDLGWSSPAPCTTLLPPAPEVTVDDGDAGYSEPAGVWEDRAEGNDGDARASLDPDAAARWSFPSLAAGRWEVFVHLPGDPAAAPLARYTVSGGGEELIAASLDQTAQGGWVSLGVVELTSGELEVAVEQRGRPVPVTNPSFEAVTVTEGGPSIPGSTVGWTMSSSYCGVVNWTDGGFIGATDDDETPSVVPDGRNGVYNNGCNVDQTLTATLAAETYYSLAAGVGRIFGRDFPGYHVQLLAGSTVISDEHSLSPPSGEFQTSVGGYLASSGDPLVGQTLKIRLNSTGRTTCFDLARLTAYRWLWADGVRVESRGALGGGSLVDAGDSGYSEEAGEWNDGEAGVGGTSRVSSSAVARASYLFTGVGPGTREIQVHVPAAGAGGAAALYTAYDGGGGLLGSFAAFQGGATAGWFSLGSIDLPGPDLEVRLERGAPEEVPVVNPSFEDPVQADGASHSGNTTGWTMNSYYCGVVNWVDGGFFGATDDDETPSVVPDGRNGIYNNGCSADQTLSATVTADTSYSLSVGVGRIVGRDFPGYHVQLIAGGVVISDEHSLSPPSGDFMTSASGYLAPPDDPLGGLPLQVRLNSSGRTTCFDWVRLTATRPLQADAVRVIVP